ncbi:hypothetical protein [Alteromonas stellipolaris]|uniref:hypothetical protein n=1 Tax=Alteromonas stellipolaris TaxID=233316 RepID=UPI001DF8CA25|nr:hypothetical protein [Alteromonas stellipolaris]MBZ2163144.1 hypothetical protein [Alteromonas stellipolaris]
MKEIIFEPITHQNEFVEINKKVLTDLGYTPKKLTAKNLLLSRKEKPPVVMGWVEDQPYRRDVGSIKSFLLTCRYAVLIILSAFFASKKIWIKHNFKPHNANGKLLYFRFLSFLLKLTKFEKIYLESYMENGRLSHPLYLSDDIINKTISEPAAALKQKDKVVLFFGSIKRYKGVDSLLRSWPKELNLLLKGHCSDEQYSEELLSVIEQRELNVKWDNKYLSDDELISSLIEADFIILPHEDDAMISSGTFYHAISYGCNVLASESKFAIAKKDKHTFVNLVDFSKISQAYLSSIFVPKKQVLSYALADYSRKALSEKWCEILI